MAKWDEGAILANLVASAAGKVVRGYLNPATRGVEVERRRVQSSLTGLPFDLSL